MIYVHDYRKADTICTKGPQCNKCNVEPPLATCLGNTPNTNLNVVNPFEVNELLVMPIHSFMFIFLSFLLNANLYLLSRELYNYIKSQIKITNNKQGLAYIMFV